MLNAYESRLFSREIGNAKPFHRTTIDLEGVKIPRGVPFWPIFLNHAELSREQQFTHENYTRFAVEIPLDGELFGIIRHRRIHVVPGEVLLIPLGENSSFGVEPGKRARKIGVGFSGPLLPSLLTETGLAEVRSLKLNDPGSFLDGVLELERIMREMPEDGIRRLSRMAYELILLLAASANMDGEWPELLADTVSVMKLNLSIPFTMAELAEKLQTSTSTLEKLFTKYLHTSPSAYFLSLRLSRAKELLERTRLPLSDIAAKIGYRYTPHFSRAFRNACGVSPLQFRHKANSEKRQ